MPTLDLRDQNNTKIGTIDLLEDVFGVKVNVPLVHQVLKAQLASRRQGTAKTKTKGEVRGGGRKPFKQKGTGNARQGSSRSPLHPGGGQTFGPQPRSYVQSTPKEMVRGALRSALSDRVRSERLIVVDAFHFEQKKTQVLYRLLQDRWKLDGLLIVDHANLNLELSGRNIPGLKILKQEGLNVYDILHSEWMIVTQAAIRSMEARLGSAQLGQVG
jgi:large subunit ribosomal protein L4